MGFCPNCGSYVSPGSNICSCGTTLGGSSSSDEKSIEESEPNLRERLISAYETLARNYFNSKDYAKAIEYYDMILDMSPNLFYPNYNKARSLYYIGKYESALAFFKKSLRRGLDINNHVILQWIGDTLNCLYRFDEAIEKYEEAIDVINEYCEHHVNRCKSDRLIDYDTIEMLCKSSIEERDERLSYMYRDIANSYMLRGDFTGSRRDYQTSLKYCEKSWKLNYGANAHILRKMIEDRLSNLKKPKPDKKHNKVKRNSLSKKKSISPTWNELVYNNYVITITGTQFYGNAELKKGMRFRLKKEPENTYDSDAIAVYLGDEKIGYVANSQDTAWDLGMTASDMKYLDYEYAEYVMLCNCKYHVAKLVK
ncbi:MAG: hypothetical protein IJ287_10650 [Methanobrevibacter sp.]|nr:hypothetical protein [Methanobrevibacter sp.]